MYRRFRVVFHSVVLILVTNAQVYAKTSCPTSFCKSIRECSKYMDLIHASNKHLNPSLVGYLKSQQCGFDEGYPKVCCQNRSRGLAAVKHSRGQTRFNRFKKFRNNPTVNSETTTGTPVGNDFVRTSAPSDGSLTKMSTRRVHRNDPLKLMVGDGTETSTIPVEFKNPLATMEYDGLRAETTTRVLIDSVRTSASDEVTTRRVLRNDPLKLMVADGLRIETNTVPVEKFRNPLTVMPDDGLRPETTTSVLIEQLRDNPLKLLSNVGELKMETSTIPVEQFRNNPLTITADDDEKVMEKTTRVSATKTTATTEVKRGTSTTSRAQKAEAINKLFSISDFFDDFDSSFDFLRRKRDGTEVEIEIR